MRLSELIEMLQDIATECGEENDPEVKLAIQPSWPFEHEIGDPVLVNEGEQGDPNDAGDVQKEMVVFIPEAGQTGYLSGAAAGAVGWSRTR